ncbi:MAG: ornithine carbamoyltransferase [Candidatus Omnitrophica bacterium]|nr:ornithine carbamoyltransferase [Candidatus Omnitrophota bacterium]
MKKDFISISDMDPKEIQAIFELTGKLKKNKSKFAKALSGKTIALIFQKPSNRTRVSFEVGMYQLGGNSIYLGPDEINLGVRESIHDVAKTLSRYCDGIVLRTYEHKNVLEMAKFASIPVINGLSDFSHPCQALADIFTVKEKLKSLKGKTLVYTGDGNNVCNSLIYACFKTGMKINVATPAGFEPESSVVRAAGGSVRLFNDPIEAAKGADVVYTDVWASMGQEDEAEKRKEIFKPFQVNQKLLSFANKGALVMHCLPAHRGQEITDGAIDSPQSVVFDEAENRMHVQKAILIKLLGAKK